MLEIIVGVAVGMFAYKWLENNVSISIKGHTTEKKKRESAPRKKKESGPNIDDHEQDELSKLNQEFVKKNYKVESSINLE